ncbi:hypothetical protein JCM9279_006544 [Rhodotorula babjevae]
MATNTRKRPADSQNKQPHKRRRPQADGDGSEQDPAATEAALKAYMHHAVRLVHKAVKKAKTFELQKLTRKLKQTREPKEGTQVDAALLADLEAQLAALKALDLDLIPSHLLTTRLSKLHSLRASPLLPLLLASLPPPKSPWAELDPQSAASKARNRVLAHKAIGDSWDEVSRAVRKRLGEDVDVMGKGKGGKDEVPKKGITMDPGRQAAIEAAFLGGEEGGEAGGEDEEGEDGAASSEDEGPAAGLSDDEGPVAGSDDEGDDEEAIRREMAALEEGVGSEGEWSGSDSDDDDLIADPSLSKKPLKRRQPSLSPSPPPTAKKQRALAPSKPITSSSFLPSLNAGYVSYSDSDGEDAKWVKDAEREDRKEAGGRKNRRGQRARQAIWEKKYGTAANHVVKQTGGTLVPLAKIKDDKAARSARRAAAAARGDAPAAPADAPERKRREFEPPQADLGWKARTGPSSSSTSTATGAASGAASGAPRPAAAGGKPAEKMHPSWEAKRKQAEALKQVSALKPQGKKITFD